MGERTAVIRAIDREQLRLKASAAQPFPHVLIDDFLEPTFAERVVRSWPSYEEAAKIGKSFHSINERQKVQVTDSRQFPAALAELNVALAEPGFLDVISTVFGIPDLVADEQLVGGGLHQTGPRGRLDVHVDFNLLEGRALHRRLNILLYFNRVWRREWGGELELWNSDVSEKVHSFEPILNRCVIFETSEISFHGVSEVTCPGDAVRRSFAGYYYTAAAPEGWTGGSHTTIFRARPDEVAKRRLMALRQLSVSAKRTVKSLVHGVGTR